MKKYFDKKNNRLVFLDKAASPDYWDLQWNVENFKKVIEGGLKNRLVVRNTKKYLSPKKEIKVLEAGCGNGQFVYAFDKLGYDSCGVDYAKKTVEKTKSIFPDLKISVQDVRKLHFPDNHFDGVWSVGVIEHFFEGYDPIIKEMKRVLKSNGYLFITFPHMSILRRIKAKLKAYPQFESEILKEKEFYQFALDHSRVIKKIKRSNFKLIKKIPYSGTKGLKDEVFFLKNILQKIYDSENSFVTLISHGISVISAFFSSHAILLIFRKK